MPSLRFREYVEAAKLAHQRAQSEQNPRAKQMLQDIERSYYRLVEIEKWWWTSNNITAHLLTSGCSMGAIRGRVLRCARISRPLRQITATKDHKSKGRGGP
jgi:hypothetical protein